MNAPHEPTYFIDRDLGLRFADALKSAGLRNDLGCKSMQIVSKRTLPVRCDGPIMTLETEAEAVSKVERITREIEKLSRSEFVSLRDWILERDWSTWDAQVEQDAESGKLEKLISESRNDYKSGRSREL